MIAEKAAVKAGDSPALAIGEGEHRSLPTRFEPEHGERRGAAGQVQAADNSFCAGVAERCGTRHIQQCRRCCWALTESLRHMPCAARLRLGARGGREAAEAPTPNPTPAEQAAVMEADSDSD